LLVIALVRLIMGVYALLLTKKGGDAEKA